MLKFKPMYLLLILEILALPFAWGYLGYEADGQMLWFVVLACLGTYLALEPNNPVSRFLDRKSVRTQKVGGSE